MCRLKFVIKLSFDGNIFFSPPVLFKKTLCASFIWSIDAFNKPTRTLKDVLIYFHSIARAHLSNAILFVHRDNGLTKCEPGRWVFRFLQLL